MIDQKLMRTLTMAKFFNGAKVAERLLYNYWRATYFAKLLQIIPEWAV